MDAITWLDRCNFPEPGSKLTLGVSGGADSLAMLILGLAGECEINVVHVDHGQRDSSAEDAARVGELAERLGATFELHRVDVGPGPNLEERLRLARYQAFPDEVAIAHTTEDQAETVLLAMLRGAGLDGLSGMALLAVGPDPARQQQVLRPILALRRIETEAICEFAGVEPIEDPSNKDLAFRRNRVRHELLPLMSKIAERDVAALLARQSEILAEERTLLNDLASELEVTNTRTLREAPIALQRRAVYLWLRSDAPTDAASVERVLAVVSGEAKATEVVGGRRVRRSDGQLYLESAAASRDSI